ncbi:hypothetical protein Tco_0980577 [Tanacetum coccineum]
MLEEELRATKSKLKLYDRLFFIMLGSFSVVCVGFGMLIGLLTMSVLGDAIAFDLDALAFEMSKKEGLALVLLPHDFEHQNLSFYSYDKSSYQFSKLLDGHFLYTMSGELCTYSSEVLISPYRLIKDEVLPNESELLFECELLSEPKLLSEMIIMFSTR